MRTYVLFIDYEKAFSGVPGDKLCNIMKNKQFPDHTVKTVKSLYVNTRLKIDKRTLVGNEEMYMSRSKTQDLQCP
jgi:hypothetical protein